MLNCLNFSNSILVILRHLPCFSLGIFQWTSGNSSFWFFQLKIFTTAFSFLTPTLPISLIRGNWEISRRELNNPRIIMVAADHSFLQSPTYEEYSASNTRSMICCRSIALIVNFFLHLGQLWLNQTSEIFCFELWCMAAFNICWHCKNAVKHTNYLVWSF